MTYDQAQSPRLGQRTPTETTMVRMIDTGADLPEVSWQGQMLYVKDTGHLQLFDSEAVDEDNPYGQWRVVSGGLSGQVTFVGSAPPPMSNAAGDLWYDTTPPDDTVDPPYPGGQNHAYRANATGVNQITDGIPPNPEFGWYSVNPEEIQQHSDELSDQQGLIEALQQAQDQIALLTAQQQVTITALDHDITLSDQQPSNDTNVDGYNDGSVWMVRDTTADPVVITELWELQGGSWSQRVFGSSGTVSGVYASELIGLIDGSQIFENAISPDNLVKFSIPITEPVTAGDIISVTTDAFGNLACKRACAAAGNNLPAHGFATKTMSSGSLPVCWQGYATIPGLTPGTKYLSATPGQVADVPPTGAGVLVQRVGFCDWPSIGGQAGMLAFHPFPPIKVN